MKILILSPNQIERYNWGHQLFRNEIGRQCDTVYYGEGYPNFQENNVKTIIKKYCPWNPDVILTYGWRYSRFFEGLGDIKNILKVHITVDYVETSNIPVQNSFFKQNKYDVVFAVTQRAANLLKTNRVCDHIEIIPFCADTNIYKKTNVIKKDQILASFTARKDIYPNRSKIQNIIKKMKIPIISKRIVHKKLVDCINSSKIIVTSNNIYKSLSMRYTETLACGGFLLADRPADLDFVGLKDGEHLVIYKNFKDLKRKIKYYMEHNDERTAIENAGMKFVRKNHSCKKRVSEMIQYINEVTNNG